MALRRKMLETLSEMAKQQNDRHSNRLQIIEPTQQELLSDYHLSQIPELKEKKTRKKAQDKALEEQAYLKYLLENPKLFEDIVMKKDKKKEEKARLIDDVKEKPIREAKLAQEQAKKKEEQMTHQQERKRLDDILDEFMKREEGDKKLMQVAQTQPDVFAQAVADAIEEETKAQQAIKALEMMSTTRNKLASVDEGIDETGAEERDDAEEEEAGEIDYITHALADNPRALGDAKALKSSYAIDASNDYNKNMELLRKNEGVALTTRQAVAVQLAIDEARKKGVAPINIPTKPLKALTTATVPAPGRQVTIKEALASSSTTSAPVSSVVARSTTASAPAPAGVVSAESRRATISTGVGPRKKM